MKKKTFANKIFHYIDYSTRTKEKSALVALAKVLDESEVDITKVPDYNPKRQSKGKKSKSVKA